MAEQTEMVERFCHCRDMWCLLTVQVPKEESDEINARGLILIVDGCKTGAAENDNYVEMRKGYTLYNRLEE